MIDFSGHIRIARPSRDLTAARRFYVDGLGLQVVHDNIGNDGEFDLIMLGAPGAAWHLELTREKAGVVVPQPTKEDLLVIYLAGPVPVESVDALLAAGGTRVAAHNKYWDDWGVTVADPDGYRVVLCEREWSNEAALAERHNR